MGTINKPRNFFVLLNLYYQFLSLIINQNTSIVCVILILPGRAKWASGVAHRSSAEPANKSGKGSWNFLRNVQCAGTFRPNPSGTFSVLFWPHHRRCFGLGRRRHSCCAHLRGICHWARVNTEQSFLLLTHFRSNSPPPDKAKFKKINRVDFIIPNFLRPLFPLFCLYALSPPPMKNGSEFRG